jgi:hypothetical protein
MSYMHCPSCGLSIHLRASFLTLDRCPRCLARRGAAVPMQISEERSWGGPTEDKRSDQPVDSDEENHSATGREAIRPAG